MKPTKPEVVVDWLDARDWDCDTLTVEQIPQRVALRPRSSKGWLVYVGKDLNGVEVHILAATYDPPEDGDDRPEYGDFTAIPSGWVRAVHYRTGRPRKVKKDGGEQSGPAKA